MTEMERDIALALLKRLWQRGLISQETYVSSCHSRFFDRNRFSQCEAVIHRSLGQEECRQDDDQKTS